MSLENNGTCGKKKHLVLLLWPLLFVGLIPLSSNGKIFLRHISWEIQTETPSWKRRTLGGEHHPWILKTMELSQSSQSIPNTGFTMVG